MEPSSVDPTPSPRRRLLRLVWHCIPLVTVMLLIGLIIFPLMQKIETQKADLANAQAMAIKQTRDLTNVVTLAVQPRRVRDKLSLPGVVKPWISLNVAAEVRGKIVTKAVEEGARVRKGDILAVIDPRDYRHTFESAAASWETAKTNEKRFKALSKKQFVTQSQLDDVSAQVKTTRAALDQAKLNLDRCTIRSPMDGVVDRVFIEYGKFMDIGDPVVSVLDIDKLKVDAGIPESDVVAIRSLTTFDMTIDALGGKTFTGTTHYLAKTTDSLARLYTLSIRLENPDHTILPDMFARVTIVKHQEDRGLAVPVYALVTQKDLTGLFVENGGKAVFKPVSTGFQDGWNILVTKGLSPGDRVVVVGQRIIEDGEPVNVTRTVTDMREIIQ